ncbi:MAG TPA: DUF3710 domain-containing protein, partial [Pilimelia sp.]|nr:DUF3710 domain-containing protein [Pilimelia sp.]
MIFSRGRRGSGRHARPEDSRRTARPGAGEFDDGLDDGFYDGDTVADEHLQGAPAGVGPFDSAEAPPDVPRLDLGSLLIPAVEGVEVRVQADPEGAIQQVVLVHGDNALQLGVFAAPRSEGIWDEVRTEIRDSLFADGMAAQEVTGDYGVELRARVRTPEGLTDLRFVGVDGPRWMVRAVYQGTAAVDPSLAGP